MTYEKYAKYRDLAKMTDNAVAVKIKVKPQILSYWKFHDSELKLEYQKRIAKLLNIPIEEILK